MGGNPKSLKLVRCLVAFIAVCGATAGVPGVASAQVPTAPSIDAVAAQQCGVYPVGEAEPAVIALGDSYSSGEGLGCYLDGTDRPGVDECRRSSLAYSAFVRPDWAHRFSACREVAIADMIGTQWHPSAPTGQVDQIPSTATAVLVTLGSADVGFARVLRACTSLLQPGTPLFVPTPAALEAGSTCSEDIATARAFAAGADADDLTARLVGAYQQMLVRMGRTARLVVALYPQVLPTSYRGVSSPLSGKLCETGRLAAPDGSELIAGFEDRYVAPLRQLQDDMNQAIRRAVLQVLRSGDTRIRLAETTFSGRTVSCVSSPRPGGYVNALSFRTDAVPALLACLAEPACRTSAVGARLADAVDQGSFHPNAVGHRAMARAVDERASGIPPLSVPLPVPTTRLPVGVPAGLQLHAVGGRGSVVWRVTGLPPGLVLSPTGVVTGNPTATGTYRATITVRTPASGDRASRVVPIVVTAGGSAIAAGWGHSCAVSAAGAARCWGLNADGQLGNGSSGEGTDATTPVEVSGLGAAVAVTAGGWHSCAVLTDSSVRCWGANFEGQLGDGTWARSDVPVEVSGLSDVRAVDAGIAHTCALLTDGTVRCWGADYDGRLGNGSAGSSYVPVPVSELGDVAAISTGDYHSCALRRDGTVRCWGANQFGQLGDGTWDSADVPVTVSGLSDVIALSAGGLHTCALQVGGTARCWGSNDFGQLGGGLPMNNTRWNVPMPVWDITGAFAVTTGEYHSCALLQGGAARCWGLNVDGQLGNDTDETWNVPKPVLNMALAVAADSGDWHSCALLSDGIVRCWGWNGHGQLGNGTLASARVPTDVSGI